MTIYATADLALVGENVLDNIVSLGKTVERVISLTLLADEAAEDVGEVVTRDDVSLSVKLGNVDLSGSVVLGLDKTASGGALAGDEKLDVYTRVVLHFAITYGRIVCVLLLTKSGDDWDIITCVYEWGVGENISLGLY